MKRLRETSTNAGASLSCALLSQLRARIILKDSSNLCPLHCSQVRIVSTISTCIEPARHTSHDVPVLDLVRFSSRLSFLGRSGVEHRSTDQWGSSACGNYVSPVSLAFARLGRQPTNGECPHSYRADDRRLLCVAPAHPTKYRLVHEQALTRPVARPAHTGEVRVVRL